MGKTKSIEEKMADDAKFRQFMDTIQKEAKTEEDRIETEMNGIIQKHYDTNKWDHARLFGNKQSDYQNYDDWGLDRVNKIIESIGNALSISDFPSSSVPGSDDASKETVTEAKDFIPTFAADYDLILSRVKAMISGVLTQFSVASSASRKTVQRDMPLSGGQHLFFGSSGSVYTQQAFFTNQFIGSFQIVFQCYMSVAEARAIALQQLLKTTEIELAYLNTEILNIREAQATSLKDILKNKPQDYNSTRAAYTLALDAVKEDRAKVMEEYNKYNSVTTTVDQLFHRLDLSEFKCATPHKNPISIDHLFNKWEAGIARRYISEKLAN